MKSKFLGGVILASLFTVCAFATPATEISYETADLGSGRWKYTYDVYNINLMVDDNPAEIKEFTIWFGYGSYNNLSIVTLDPPSSSWSEIVVQPEPVLTDDGYYDALTLTSGISVGQNVYGFAVSFDWLGTGTPGKQFYEIIDPIDFHTIESGYTPEPATLLLFGLGSLLLRKKW